MKKKMLNFQYSREQSWQAGMQTKIGDCATIFSDVVSDEGNEGVEIHSNILKRLNKIEPIKILNCWENPETYHVSVVEGRSYLQIGWGSNSPTMIVKGVFDLLQLEGVTLKVINNLDAVYYTYGLRKRVSLTNILMEIFGLNERVILTQSMLDEEKTRVISRATAAGEAWAQKYKMNEGECIKIWIRNQTPYEEHIFGGKGGWDRNKNVKILY